MSIATNDAQMAAGYDNAAGLVAIATITPASDRRAFYEPQETGYSEGVVKVRADGTLFYAGFASVTWLWRVVTWRQVQYLRDTYCAGGYAGKVTVRLRLDTTTYANYNAVLVIPQPAESARNFENYTDFAVRFTRLDAL